MRFGRVSVVSCTLFATLTTVVVCSSNAMDDDDRRRGRRPVVEDGKISSPSKNTGPQKLITISKETTFITEPLDEQGFVNYVQAINDRMKPEGITPENNAAVLIWQAIGWAEADEEWVNSHANALGVPPIPKNGDYLVNLYQFANQKLATKNPNRSPEEKKAFRDQIFDQQGKVSEGPWTAADYPLMAEWVKLNEKPLAKVHAAMKRPLHYRPYVMPVGEDGKPGMMVAILLPDIQSYRGLARVLKARAMLHLGNGDTAKCQQDLMATHQLARLTVKSDTLIEQLVGIAIDTIALYGDQQMALHGDMSAAELLEYRKQLEALPPVSDMHRSLNYGERFMGLDAIISLARGIRDDQNEDVAGLLGSSFAADGPLRQFLFKMSFNWNEVLLVANGWYDRIAEASRLPYQQRKKTSEEFDVEFTEMRKDATSASGIAKAVLLGPKERGKYLGNVLMALLLPAVDQATIAQDASILRAEITKLAFSLQAYHKDHGEYPKTLTDLKPRYATQIPADIFASGPLKYTTDGKSFKLYSVGRNETDDGGFDEATKDYPHADDIVVKSTGAK